MAISDSPYAVAAALLPILWLLTGLAVLRMKALIVCPSGLLLSLALACFVWGFEPLYALQAVLDGAVFAVFPILWIIIAAFFTYSVSLHTGADRHIKNLLASISADARIQALVIAWGFGSFMESVAGFGTAVVIPAAMLISLGFSPLLAAVLALLSNTIAVAFGVVGIPMQTLAWVTDLDVYLLSRAVIIQLGLLTLAVPFLLVACVTRSVAATLELWAPALFAGLSFALSQYLVVRFIGPELAAVAGSLCSILCIVVFIRLFPPKSSWTFAATGSPADRPAAHAHEPIVVREQIKAWSPYIFLFLIVVLSSKLFPSVHSLVGQVKSTLAIYTGPGGKPLTITWLTTPGTIALVAAIAGGLWQGATPRALARIYGATLTRLAASSFTIISIVCMAKVLSYSGMMLQLSGSVALLAGKGYPAIAPFIGALGSFITGSDTSANILFGGLQKQVALHLGFDPIWIAASNTSGACIGKLVSPQNIALAAVATGLAGQEGKLLRVGMLYALPFLLVLGAVVMALA